MNCPRSDLEIDDRNSAGESHGSQVACGLRKVCVRVLTRSFRQAHFDRRSAREEVYGSTIFPRYSLSLGGTCFRIRLFSSVQAISASSFFSK